jgi:hypothetical protein
MMQVKAGSGGASAEKKREVLNTINAVQAKVNEVRQLIKQIEGSSYPSKNNGVRERYKSQY